MERRPIEISRQSNEFEQTETDDPQKLLDMYFRKGLKHERSKALPVNKTMSDPDAETRYRSILEDYVVPDEEIETYNRTHPGESKEDYQRPNTGWKLHLNVAPTSVRTVSEYLRSNGFVHKYLSGGESADGKIFTLYIGSHALVKKLSEAIARDLPDHLSRPAETEPEIELAPGVIGRFAAGDDRLFHAYGSSGFSLLWQDMRQGSRIKEKDAQARFFREAEARAFQTLREMYGDYFFAKDQNH